MPPPKQKKITGRNKHSISTAETFGAGSILTTPELPDPLVLHDWFLEVIPFNDLSARLYDMETVGWTIYFVQPAFGGGLYNATNKLSNAIVLYHRPRR